MTAAVVDADAAQLTGAPAGATRSRSSLAVVYATVFLDLLGFGVILPMLPFYAEHFGATGVWVGALLTAYSAAQFLAAPVLGRISDRVGRKPVLVASLVGSSVSLAMTGFADTLGTLIAARALAGLFGGSISAAQAYLADVTAPRDRARAMGKLGAAIGMGFILGPALGSMLAHRGFGSAAFVAASIAAASTAMAAIFLRESLPAELRRRRRTSRLLALVAAVRRGTITGILASWFLSTLAFVTMESTLALLGERRFALDPRRLGLVFAFSGVVMVIVQGGLVGRMDRRFGERRMAMVGAAAIAAALVALPLVPSLPLAMLVLAMMAAGQGFLGPSLSALLSRHSAADEQGGILGLGQSMSAAARATGPVAAGWLFDRAIGLPYLVAAIAAAAIVPLLGWRRPAAAPEAE